MLELVVCVCSERFLEGWPSLGSVAFFGDGTHGHGSADRVGVAILLMEVRVVDISLRSF